MVNVLSFCTGMLDSSYLYSGQIFWSLFHIHSAESHGNGSRGDNDDPVSIVDEGNSGFDDEGKNRQQGLMSLLVDY